MRNVALITGAGRRIGKSLAQFLAERGWDIAIHVNRLRQEGNEAVAGFREQFPLQKFESFQTDLSFIEQAETLIHKVNGKMGKVSLLINCASVFLPGTISGTSTGLFDLNFNVNLRAPFILTREFAQQTETGLIVNMADTRITKNFSEHAAYTLSKKALWELTKMAALEFAPRIRVNAIAPGIAIPPKGKNENYLNKLAINTPMRKVAGIKPILSGLSYILENDSLTGQLFFCDSGEQLL